jgi:DNA helicase-2/ATP-dependent DNA helicase PcrA
MVLTFTNRAAKELVSRLTEMLGAKARRLWAGTYHGVCLKILRQEAYRLGYPAEFWIADDDDSSRILRHAAEEAGYDCDVVDFKAVASTISWYKNAGVMPEDVIDDGKAISKLYKFYQESLLANGLMDYDDLLLNTVRIFNDDKILKKWQKKFQYILVDEWQDTAEIQCRLATMLSGKHHNLFVVGDINQSVYSWRGAQIENTLGFIEGFPNAKLFKLGQNYRSTKKIVAAVNQVAGASGELANVIWTENDEGSDIVVRQFCDESEEAAFIVDEIIRQNYGLSDTAVLARTRRALRMIEKTMLVNAVPCKVVGQIAFVRRKEIKDILGYLQLVIDQGNDEAFLRIVNSPKRGIGDSTIHKLIQYGNDNHISLYQSCKYVDTNIKTHKLIDEFCNMIAGLQLLPLTPMIMKDICEESGYIEHLQYVEEWERLSNIKLLLDMAHDYRKQPIREFLDYLSMLDERESDPDRVSLMTCHSAKGLEFPVVFVTGVNEGLLPHHLAIQDNTIDEERRLFYVAISRAMKHLYLTHSQYRTVAGRPTRLKPSRFLKLLEEGT